MHFLSQFDAYHEQASKVTGLHDFGPRDYVEPMKLLLSDYDNYGDFSELGIASLKAEVVNLLRGRLIAQQGFNHYQDKIKKPVNRPLILAGFSRTGSTALHRLLAKDPANQWLEPWLTAYPMPRPPAGEKKQSAYYQEYGAGLEYLYQLCPNIKKVHPMTPDDPDECRFAMDHTFWSMSIGSQATVPDYAAWVLQHDARPVFERHRQTLNLIANGDERRWLLKDPSTYPLDLKAMLDVFPDACVVITHRDPVTWLTSVVSLVYELRHLREPNLTAQMNGKQHVENWTKVIEKAERHRRELNADRFLDVHISETNRDPVGTAIRIYEHFGLPVTDEAINGWQAHVAADPRAGHGKHVYKPEDYSITPNSVYDRIGDYLERYTSLYGGLV